MNTLAHHKLRYVISPPAQLMAMLTKGLELCDYALLVGLKMLGQIFWKPRKLLTRKSKAAISAIIRRLNHQMNYSLLFIEFRFSQKLCVIEQNWQKNLRCIYLLLSFRKFGATLECFEFRAISDHSWLQGGHISMQASGVDNPPILAHDYYWRSVRMISRDLHHKGLDVTTRLSWEIAHSAQ